MNKKAVLVGVIAINVLTSCMPFGHKRPTDVVIDGVTYKTGFYSDCNNSFDEKAGDINLWPDLKKPFKKIEEGKKEEDYYDHIEGDYYYWKIDVAFDMYAGIDNDSASFFPSVYVKEEKYDEALSYYLNPDNYDYCIHRSYHDGIEKTACLVEDPSLGRVIEPLVQEYKSSFDFKRKHPDSEAVVVTDFIDALKVFRKSKDGLFKTLNIPLIYSEGRMGYFYEHVIDGDEALTTMIPFDKETSDTLCAIFKEKGLI